MVKNNLNQREINALNCLNELELNYITVPYRIEGTDLYMQDGKTIEKGRIDKDKLFKECLSKMYRISFQNYSSGFYAFWKTNELPKLGERYGTYLSRIVKNSPCDDECRELRDFCVLSLNKNIRKLNEFDSFYLLHGDLHLGNILLYDNKYKLIDFEFMRIGPIEIELVFLFYWTDVCTNNCKLLEKKVEFDSFVGRNRIDVSKELSWEIFLPFLLLEGWLACISGQYKNNRRILYGIKRIWKEYRDDIFD